MSKIRDLKVHRLNLPLKYPFETSLGVQKNAKNVLIAIFLESGVIGIGEAAPSSFVTSESQNTVIEAIETVRDQIIGKEIQNIRGFSRKISKVIYYQRSARAAIEMALLDGYCKFLGVSIYEYLGSTKREIETDLTIPIVPSEKAAQIAKNAAADGFRIFKIKVGKDFETDLERVSSVRDAVGESSIRIDANQGFSPKEAVQFVEALKNLDIEIEIFEQPVLREDIEGMKFVRDNIGAPVFADESVFTPNDAMRLCERDAVDGITIKLMKSGVFETLDIISIAELSNLELMMGCMGESSIGISFSAQIASSFPIFDYIDLDSPFFYKKNLMKLKKSPILEFNGPGIEVDYNKIKQLEVIK